MVTNCYEASLRGKHVKPYGFSRVVGLEVDGYWMGM